MNKKDEFQRYKGENVFKSGIITLAFGLLPMIVILVSQSVRLSGIHISVNMFIFSVVVCLFLGGIGNAVWLNSKYKRKQNL